MADNSKLEQKSFSDEYADRIAEWDSLSVALICREIGKIGKMTPEEAKKYDAKKQAKKVEKKVLTALSAAVLLNTKGLPKAYSDLFGELHKEAEYLYKYKGVPFGEIGKDKSVQKIIKRYAKKSSSDLIELTKAVKVIDSKGNAVALRHQILKSFDDASQLVINGEKDFYSVMRKTVLELGGSGARVEYPNGLTRRLDTVVRQNMAYNIKMASREYNKHIGDKLGCDGIEVSFSVNPRPTHRFMEGRQFCNGKSKEINGIHFDGAEDTRDVESGQNVLESLDDYNCNHRETPIICGISEPAYSPRELARLKSENERELTIGNSTGDGYYWSQRMRHLEAETRNAKDQINALEAFGDAGSKAKARELRKQIKEYRAKYDEICNATNIKPDYRRMSIPKTN